MFLLSNCDSLVCDLIWRFLCPFFRNLHLRENLARDCFTSTVSTVTNSVQNIFTHLSSIVTNKLLQPLTTTWYDSLVLSFSLLKIWRRSIKHQSFLCVLRPVLRSWWAFSFADGAVVCSTSLSASLIMKHETPARCRASRSMKQSSGLQKDYKFKFKYFIASYTWQGVYQGSCNKVSHTHENVTKHNITKKLC